MARGYTKVGSTEDKGSLTAEQIQECLALGATYEQIKDLAASGFPYETVKSLSKTLGEAKGQGQGISSDDLRTILVDQRKAMKPENERHPDINVFSYPEGNVARPKPRLTRKTYFNGLREDDDVLTPVEIELYNRCDGVKTARNGMWKAEVVRNGSEEVLKVTTEPKTLDGRQSLPQLSLILRELVDGEAMANPDALAERVAELEALIKSGGLAQAGA